MCNHYRSSKMRYGFYFVLCVLFVLCPIANAKIVGVSLNEYETCRLDELGEICESKELVTTAVSYGLTSLVRYKMCPGSGGSLDLELTKTIPTLTYPLKYFHTVSYYPYENVVKVVDPNSDYSGCIACPNSLCPTCGWQYDDANNVIEDSQGFCSYKTLGEPTCSSWRGEELLGEHSSDVNRFSTAHCLRKDELLYNGYEIGRYLKNYKIKIKATIGTSVNEIELTPSDPIVRNTFASIVSFRAILLGDMPAARGAPELDNYILYIPAFPADHPYVQNWQDNMLLVPREEISKDGSEFDKVGIDFYKFRMMGAASAVTEAGDGLHNQLFQKHGADLEQLITNPEKDTTYLVKYMRPFKDSMDFDDSGMPKALVYTVPDIEYSLIKMETSLQNLDTLEVNALFGCSDGGLERVSEIINESQGFIFYTQVDTFDSLTGDGVLKVGIANNGYLKANYIVTVTEETLNVREGIAAQAVTLEPIAFRIEELTFDIHTKQNVTGTHQFRITLKSPTGRIYRTLIKQFDTTEHGIKYPRDLQMKNEGSQVSAPDASPTGDITCDDKVDYYDLRVLADSWLEEGSFSDLADWPYCDKVINWYDFSVLAGSWQEGTI